ncbi:O-methyltransferase [Xanthocytophaga flava]|uniref:O-methyltransferase n=1 Tax=Xanthocytophaga flava TaxID=3048013 RepID=UPI0028D622DC|nr:class I SAM-dependent methyltransferase [Xanthocytophaga flavus]
MIFLRYLQFWLRSGNAHAIHSPFVFQLYNQVIRNTKPYYCFETLEDSRMDLLTSQESITIKDFGAGSRVNTSKQRKIRDLAHHSEKSPNLAQLLFRLVNYFQPATIFDLGTCLGTTTLYLAHGYKHAQLYTFEGDPGLANLARQRFEKFHCSHIRSVVGNIDVTLEEALKEIDRLDFVFFDANHRKEPTLRYFEQCLRKSDENSVFVFDDIYWSEEMQQAWQQIKKHPSVTLTVDLFYIGIVFFRKKQPVQHFTLRS